MLVASRFILSEPMADSVTIDINEKVEKAYEKFNDEFKFSKMDTTIYKAPTGLRDVFDSTYSYFVPRFVAIGPYHKAEVGVQKMEEVKKAAAFCICVLMEIAPNDLLEKMMKASETMNQARQRYVDSITENDASFAAMMFYDACFLLLYMVAYSSSCGYKEDYAVKPSMRRFLFSNRDSINNDIMLLENQLPWTVIQAFMDLVEEHKRHLLTAVGEFIAGLGKEFKVAAAGSRVASDHPENKPYVWDDKNDPPPHLLALLRRYKTEVQRKPAGPAGRSDLPLPPTTTTTLDDERRQPILDTNNGTTAPNDGDDHRFTVIPTVSPMELEQIGIKLKGSKTAAFSDMGFAQGLFCSELYLAPLSLSDARATCLVNIAAWEVCTASRFGDHPDRTAVCSYLALLNMLVVREEDVHTLRSKGLLCGAQTDKEILTFFKAVGKHLPDTVSRFATVVDKIHEYKSSRRIWIPTYKWVYKNYGSIVQVASIVKVVTFLATLLGLYKAVLSLRKQD